jgi:hypothetical protein
MEDCCKRRLEIAEEERWHNLMYNGSVDDLKKIFDPNIIFPENSMEKKGTYLSRLIAARKLMNFDMIKYILSIGADPNLKPFNYNILWDLICSGREDVFVYMLQNGFNPNLIEFNDLLNQIWKISNLKIIFSKKEIIYKWSILEDLHQDKVNLFLKEYNIETSSNVILGAICIDKTNQVFFKDYVLKFNLIYCLDE